MAEKLTFATLEERKEYAQAMRDAGHTLEDIGALLGITRERVRQITAKRGAFCRNVDLAQLLAHLRNPQIATMGDLAEAVGVKRTALSRFLRHAGLLPAATRLLHWRRTYPTRVRIAAVLDAEYVRLGRTPTMLELAAPLGLGANSTAPLLCCVFGSIRKAMEYAGVPHRSVRQTGPEKFATHRARSHCPQCGDAYHVYPGGAKNCKRCVNAAKRQRNHARRSA